MTLVPAGYEAHVRAAIVHYWKTLDSQSNRQRENDADRGRRSAVTGGKQMDGFCDLISWLLQRNGVPEKSIYVGSELELPGFFRPTKKWDMLVVHEGIFVAALEFKSQRGPSFGNNFNNRSEEAIGTGADIAKAYRDGIFGRRAPVPWLGWLMLLDAEGSTRPVGVAEPHFQVFPEFRDSSYAQRYELLLRKLRAEKFYDGAAFLTTTENDAATGNFSEPADDLSMKKFLAGLAGHVRSFMEAP